MTALNLRPLPSLRSDDHAATAAAVDGFVDEDVIMALVSGTLTNRPPVDPSELVLAVDGDFAGWCLPSARVFEPAVLRPPAVEARRPSPPELEPGLGPPHQGAHRWWLAGLAGALSTLLFSALLLSLSEQGVQDSGTLSIIRVPAKTQPAPVESANAPQLTGSPSVPDVR